MHWTDITRGNVGSPSEQAGFNSKLPLVLKEDFLIGVKKHGAKQY